MSAPDLSKMTAEEILALGKATQTAAYATPPISPEGLALVVVVVPVILIAFSTIVICLRVYARLFKQQGARAFGWDDGFAVLAWGTFTVSALFAIKAAYYGLGTPDVGLTPTHMIRCAEYMLYSNVLYGFSTPMVKAAVLFSLLQFTKEPKYRWILYIMQFLATVMALVGILASLLYCSPTPAYWNPMLGKCGDFMVVVNIGYAWTAVGIATDWICAIIPWFVIRKLQMARKTKITVMVILGLGAVSALASIIRAPYLQYYLVQEDRLYWNGHITIWCLVESGLGIVACSLPALRSLFVRFLESSRTGYGYGSKGGRSNDKSGNGTQMDNLRSGAVASKGPSSNGNWSRLDDESSTKGIILRERNVVIETESLSDLEQGKIQKSAAGRF